VTGFMWPVTLGMQPEDRVARRISSLLSVGRKP
jgi:hypothetical protein